MKIPHPTSRKGLRLTVKRMEKDVEEALKSATSIKRVAELAWISGRCYGLEEARKIIESNPS